MLPVSLSVRCLPVRQGWTPRAQEIFDGENMFQSYVAWPNLLCVALAAAAACPAASVCSCQPAARALPVGRVGGADAWSRRKM
jgi:hypothetical protein